ncbi:MAG: hypothetical protein LBQ02_03505 [Candidatus Nomurabacteria bacterium]|nr:hypothetical protein [Candidatus Nomurabacteria bacterium]
MKAQEYILAKLSELKKPLSLATVPAEDLEREIVRYILSKKFRKYSIAESVRNRIESAVHECVTAGKPIQAVTIFGGYKLWRLDESPETDWAELFTLMYYIKWLKPICEIYKPGVWLDFFSDDVIVPIINNIPVQDLEKYRASFNELLSFLKQYQPKNLSITLTRVGDQYKNHDEFLADLTAQKKELELSLDGGLPKLDGEPDPTKSTGEAYHGAPTSRTKDTIDLNVKATPKQKQDQFWREKVLLTHDAYMLVKGRRPYYQVPDKFDFLTGRLEGRLVLGSTKNSTMKFWIGVGVLLKNGETYQPTVLSPNQLSRSEFDIEEVQIDGLAGKNFSKIRLINKQ